MARRPLGMLLGAAACGAFALVVWGLVFHVDRAQWADAAALHGFTRLQTTRVAPWANDVAHLADAGPYAVLAAAVVLMAFKARGPRVAAVIPLILLGANALTQFLKPALAAPRPYLEFVDEVDAASWPSGHSTAAMALALCAVLAAPAGWRAAIAIAGAVYAVAIAYAVVLLSWHFPSDALGGFAVAGGFTCLGVAALRAADRRWPARTGRAVAARAAVPLVAAGGAVAVLAALVAGAKVLTLMPDTERQLAFLAAAGSIGAIALALLAAVVASLRA
jgi:membrane-associated phospholipid phosphatase